MYYSTSDEASRFFETNPLRWFVKEVYGSGWGRKNVRLSAVQYVPRTFASLGLSVAMNTDIYAKHGLSFPMDYHIIVSHNCSNSLGRGRSHKYRSFIACGKVWMVWGGLSSRVTESMKVLLIDSWIEKYNIWCWMMITFIITYKERNSKFLLHLICKLTRQKVA